MSAPLLGYALAAAAYAGFQLTVRLVVYPQLARVPAEAAADFERAHQRLITPLVGALFGALALATGALLVAGPRGTGLAAAALFGGVLAATAFGAVPHPSTPSCPAGSTRPRTGGSCAGTPSVSRWHWRS